MAESEKPNEVADAENFGDICTNTFGLEQEK